MKNLGKITDAKDITTKEYVDNHQWLTDHVSLRNYQRGTSDIAMFPVVDRVRANRLAFLPADQIIVEKTTDGGTTWVSAGMSDSDKRSVFTASGAITIPALTDSVRSTSCGVRITITGMKYNVPANTAETDKYNYWNSTYVLSTERYCSLDRFWFWVSSTNDSMSVKVERATGAASTTWYNAFNDTSFSMTGWSGADWVKTSSGVFGGGTTQTGNYWNWRITCFMKPASGDTFSGSGNMAIYHIRGYGENVWTSPNPLAYHDRLYSYDVNKNATFPAKIVAGAAPENNMDVATKKYVDDTNTKNTAGSSNDTDKLYIVGAKSQDSTGVQTYSNSNVYEQDGKLYASELKSYVTAGQKSNTTLGTKATAEGNNTTASGNYSHAEGNNTTASGNYSHAEGSSTKATGTYSHAEGSSATASNNNTHAEGSSTTASGHTSHAEGSGTTASGYASHAEGSGTKATGDISHSEGIGNYAIGECSHVEGESTRAFGSRSHAEGYSSVETVLVEVSATSDSTQWAYTTLASTIRNAQWLVGTYTYTDLDTTVFRKIIAVDDVNKIITLDSAFPSGVRRYLYIFSRATMGDYSHTEGQNTRTVGTASNAIGNETEANGDYSHAEGLKTVAQGKSQHVFGEYNAIDSGTISTRGTYVEVVGNGTADDARSNARTLDWNGNETLAGKLTVGAAPTNNMDVATKKYVDDSQAQVVTLSTTSGTLTSDQLSTLQASNENYIMYSNGRYILVYKTTTELYYEWISAALHKIQYFKITISSGAYTYNEVNISTTDTKNTAGSTDTSSKIFLVGATSQAANPQTYSDNQVYATNGQLDANSVRIAEAVSLVYDSTNKCLNFNFS